ncbi:hypothetical protein GCM10011369_22220 [Neiella marina]|uniref:EAL domain-containing protein n=1 Tax=Neiella marina TaxID=508461 RepID=A0A8J2U5J6_9GAMM|nr:GGDEF and EAL domain-containing protein [Neiella marina]GGA79798.1 hypothetical protein GCM10011369_22220 [Neiella marina]
MMENQQSTDVRQTKLAQSETGWPSLKEWFVIAVGVAICIGIYSGINVNTSRLLQAKQTVEIISSARSTSNQVLLFIQQSDLRQTKFAIEQQLISVQQLLHLLQHGGNYQQQTIAAVTTTNQQSAQFTSAQQALLELTTSLSTAEDYDNHLQAAMVLEQALAQLERHFQLQQSSQIDSFYSLQLGLIAVVLLITAAGVIVLRRSHAIHQSNEQSLKQSETAAKHAAEQLQLVIDGAELGFYDWDYNSGTVSVNSHWLEFLGLPADRQQFNIEEIMGRIHPDDSHLVQQQLNECIQTGSGYTLEYRQQHQLGHWVWFEDSGKVVEVNHHASGNTQRICGTVKNISKRKQAELEYRENERRFRHLIEALPTVAVQGYNRDREVIYWNDASRRVYGFSKQEALGQRLEHLIIPEPMRDAVVQAHHEWVSGGKEIPASELNLLHKDGHLVPVFSSHVMLNQDTDNPEMFCVDVDLTDQHRTAAELKRLASKDLLTNLPNRRFLEEELNRRLAEARRFDQQLALLFIDLDLFKDINDSMGHNAGDHLLQQVADRLKAHLRHYDTLSRFGGDEFIIVLPNMSGRNEIQTVADKVMAEFEHTYRLFEQDIYVTASIGISMYPDDGESSAELLKFADAAMYQAKESGRNRYRFFAASMNEQLNRQRQIAINLRQSLDRDEFHLVFQPQVDLRNQHIIACEALLRWQPKEAADWASPAEFIPVAERSDLIIRLGQWVIQAACRQVAKWRSQQLLPIRVDINVSGKQLQQPGFFNFFSETLAEYGLTPKDIGIELTENVLIGADQELLRRLTSLHESGMEVSIDDFGAGYSSLSYLKHFPVHTLKIDRAFVVEAPYQDKDKAILEAIVQVGHKLGLNIVVEGIETEQQAIFCQKLHCDLAQGYYFYKPMPANQLAELLAQPS